MNDHVVKIPHHLYKIIEDVAVAERRSVIAQILHTLEGAYEVQSASRPFRAESSDETTERAPVGRLRRPIS